MYGCIANELIADDFLINREDAYYPERLTTLPIAQQLNTTSSSMNSFAETRTMISTSPFSCERVRTNENTNHHQSNKAREPLNNTPMRNNADAGFCTGKIQSLRTRSYPESPRHKSSLMKLSSQNSSSLTSLLQEKAKTRVGLRNPPHMIYRALQEHKLKMVNALNDTQNSNQAGYFHQLRQQLHSIEEELKKILAEDQQQPDATCAAEEGPQRAAPRRRNSIGRCTNIAHEIESIRHALLYDLTPQQQQQQEQQQRQQRRRRNRKHSFPVPLSIPEGEEEHCLWSSCPSLVYEPEPRDLPPKLPTRR